MKLILSTLLICFASLPAGAYAGNTAATCPSAKATNPTLEFNVGMPANGTYIKAPVSVMGDGSRTWIRYQKDALWAVPYVSTMDGKELFLSWQDDGECMVVDLGGQDFQIGLNGESADVHRVN